MKTYVLFLVALFFALVFFGCKETETPTGGENGILKFEMANSWRTKAGFNAVNENPPLQGDTTFTYTTSLKLCVGEIFVSKGDVKQGDTNTLVWEAITDRTNLEAKFFEDYTFSPRSLPAGEYKSIKIVFRNVFYRYAQLISDPTVGYELLETMGSWTDPCDITDSTWAETNYFGPDGLHFIENDTFKLVQPNEKIAGFTIEPDRTAVLTWRLGAGVETPCTTFLIDKNGNREWDCGIDRMDFDCPSEVEYMWDFVVNYE